LIGGAIFLGCDVVRVEARLDREPGSVKREGKKGRKEGRGKKDKGWEGKRGKKEEKRKRGKREKRKTDREGKGGEGGKRDLPNKWFISSWMLDYRIRISGIQPGHNNC
jgi:hypothetical protein